MIFHIRCKNNTQYNLSVLQLLLGGFAFHIVPLGILCVEPQSTGKSGIPQNVYYQKLQNGTTQKVQNYGHNKDQDLLIKNGSTRTPEGHSYLPKPKCMDWSILQNFHVVIVMLFTFVFCMAASSHYAYCGALVQQKGLSREETSYLLSASGISDVMGNVTLGILFDVPLIKRRSTLFYCLLNLLFSAIILAIPFLDTFPTLFGAFAFWGMLSACNTTKNVILSDNVNKKQLADAVGLSLMAMALGYGLGPIFTGTNSIVIAHIRGFWKINFPSRLTNMLTNTSKSLE